MPRVAKEFFLSIIKYIHAVIVPIILIICLLESVFILMLQQEVYFSDELYRIVLEDNVKLSIDNYNLEEENSFLKERCSIGSEENDDPIDNHIQKLNFTHTNRSLHTI